MKLTGVIILLLFASSCSFFKKKQDIDKDVIARVNEEYLYAGDVESLTHGLHGEDSIAMLKSYAESWVRKKLLLQKAIDNIEEDDAGITRKVDEYRESLLLYEYEKALINKRLDTTFNAEELNAWYDKMKTLFPLPNDVYRVYFVKFKKDVPDLGKVRKLIINPKDEDADAKLRGYCKEFAITYSLDEGMWYEKDVATKNFPISEGDIWTLTATRQFKEIKAGDEVWFIKIAQVLKKDEPSPLEFVKDQVRKAIMEKRKMELLDKTYNKIYNDGISSKSVDIYPAK